MATAVMQDVTYEIEQAFAPQPVYVQRIPATREGVKALLETLISEKYISQRSATIATDANYFEAFNRGWLQPAGRTWADGSPYARHAITPRGRAVLDVLRAELDPPVATDGDDPVMRDEYSAEWLDTLSALETAGRIALEVVDAGVSMDRPVRYSADRGWTVKEARRQAASNFKRWIMQREIVISANEAAAVERHDKNMAEVM